MVTSFCPKRADQVAELYKRLNDAVNIYWRLAEDDQPLTVDFQAVNSWESMLATLPEHAGRPAAFVKVFRDPASFRREHRAVVASQALIVDRPDGSRARVPALLCALEAQQALVLERIDGTVLGTRIRRDYPFLKNRYVPALRALGSWLRLFHALDRPSTSHHDILERQLTFIRSTLQRAEPRIGPGPTGQAHRLLGMLGEELGARPRPLKWCHGDFQPDNIIVGGQTLHVVDFAFSDGGWKEQDLVLLWHNLRTGLCDLPFGPRAARLLWSAFLSGYGLHAREKVDGCVWDLFELRYQSFTISWTAHLDQRSTRQKLRSLYRYVLGLHHFRHWLDGRIRAYGL